jgi:hypothetical protein
LTARPRWAREPQLSVFVNCPYDEDYRACFDAIVFTCVHAGFFPWIAASTGSVARGRIDRILEGLEWCRYSIHDLTRYRGEGAENLSRFNMPLELGIAMGVRGQHAGEDAHDWMVMGPPGHVFHGYVSDLAGIDPLPHDGTPERVCTAVLAWLVARPDAAIPIGPAEVLEKLKAYSDRKRALDREWSTHSPPWGAVLDAAIEIVRG